MTDKSEVFEIGQTVKVSNPDPSYTRFKDRVGKIYRITTDYCEPFYHVFFNPEDQTDVECFTAHEIEAWDEGKAYTWDI